METSSVPPKLSRGQNFRSARKLITKAPEEERPEIQTRDTFSKMKSALRAIKFIRYAKDLQAISNEEDENPLGLTLKKKVSTRQSLIAPDKAESPVDRKDPEDLELIINVLAIDPKDRWNDEVLFLQTAFKDIEFFKELESQVDKNAFKKIFQRLKLEFHNPGEKVFSSNDAEKNFYIIIKGSVSVLIKPEVSEQTETEDSIAIFNSNDIDLAEIQDPKKSLIRSRSVSQAGPRVGGTYFPGFSICLNKDMSKGDFFGAITLNKLGLKKKHTIFVCKTDAILAVLSYHDYYSILSEVYARKYSENIQFLSTIDLFKHWNHNKIAALLQNVEERKYGRNHTIFREGDKASHLYFIKEGEIELQKSVETEKDREENIYSDSQNASKSVRSSTSFPKLRTRQKPRRLAILTRGDYFGDSELFDGNPRSCTAITYSSDLVLLLIKRDRFMGLVTDKISLKNLEEHIQNKRAWREGLLTKLSSVPTTITENNSPVHKKTSSLKLRLDEATLPGFSSSEYQAAFLTTLNSTKKSVDVSSLFRPANEIISVNIPIGGRKPGKPNGRTASLNSTPRNELWQSLTKKTSKHKKNLSIHRDLSFLQPIRISEQDLSPTKQKLTADSRLYKELDSPTLSRSPSAKHRQSLQYLEPENPKMKKPMNKYQSATPRLASLNATESEFCFPRTVSNLTHRPEADSRKGEGTDREKGMFKLIKTLGLNRVYADKELPAISYQTRTNFMTSCPSSPVMNEKTRVGSIEMDRMNDTITKQPSLIIQNNIFNDIGAIKQQINHKIKRLQPRIRK